MDGWMIYLFILLDMGINLYSSFTIPAENFHKYFPNDLYSFILSNTQYNLHGHMFRSFSNWEIPPANIPTVPISQKKTKSDASHS